MIDIIKTNIFPKNVISGVATGYNSPIHSSYFETTNYNSSEVFDVRNEFKGYIGGAIIDSYYYQKQIHSDIIRVITHSNINDISESDGIITNEKGIMLNVSIADCQAILLFDPKTETIGAVHSGWKGTKLNIVGKAISTMIDKFNANSSDILVYLSPSASCDNYEVGEEFVDFFPNTVISKNGKYYFDNKAEIISQLRNSGVDFKNIESNNECTIDNKRLHSYRRDKTKSGRMSAFIGLFQQS